MKRIGLIAGQGDLPIIWAQRARQRGYQIYLFLIGEEKINLFDNYVKETFRINLGAWEQLVELLKKNQIPEVIMLGKVNKNHLLNNFEPDRAMQKIMAGLPNFGNQNILQAVVKQLEDEGVQVLKQSTFLEDMLAQSGLLIPKYSGRLSLKKIKVDMKYGLEIARQIARIDIGQTVIVKNKIILAIEAVEGTNATIRRGAKLGGSGVIMVKVSEPEHDFRFDIPTVGLETIEQLKSVKACGLAIEAGKVLVINKQEFLQQANDADIAVMAF